MHDLNVVSGHSSSVVLDPTRSHRKLISRSQYPRTRSPAIHQIEHLILAAKGFGTHNWDFLVRIHRLYSTGEVLFERGGLARWGLDGHGDGLGYVALLMDVQQNPRQDNERRSRGRREKRPKGSGTWEAS